MPDLHLYIIKFTAEKVNPKLFQACLKVFQSLNLVSDFKFTVKLIKLKVRFLSHISYIPSHVSYNPHVASGNHAGEHRFRIHNCFCLRLLKVGYIFQVFKDQTSDLTHTQKPNGGPYRHLSQTFSSNKHSQRTHTYRRNTLEYIPIWWWPLVYDGSLPWGISTAFWVYLEIIPGSGTVF